MNRGAHSTVVVPRRPSHNPSHALALETLFHNFDFDFELVSSSIDPILTVQNRCQTTSLYIQGIVIRKGAFISTNLTQDNIYVTFKDSQWSIGSDSGCDIAVATSDLARRHAVLHYNGRHFALENLGSGQIYVNGSLLPRNRQIVLDDGDIIDLEQLRVEFFLDHFMDICSSETPW